MKLVSTEIWQNLREFCFWAASAVNSISYRRHMKQNPSKLIKELNAEHPAEVICSSSPALHTAGSSTCATGPVWLLKHPTAHISETSDHPHFTVPLSQGKNIFHQRGRKRFFPGTPGRASERRWSPGGISRLWALSHLPVWWEHPNPLPEGPVVVLGGLPHPKMTLAHWGHQEHLATAGKGQAGPRCCCRPVHPESPGEFKNFRGMWCTSEILKWNIPSFHQVPTPRVVSSRCCNTHGSARGTASPVTQYPQHTAWQLLHRVYTGFLKKKSYLKFTFPGKFRSPLHSIQSAQRTQNKIFLKQFQ